MKKKIGILDLNISNLESVKSACIYEEIDFKIIKNKNDFQECHGLIIPGVGSFGQAINNLLKNDLYDLLKKEIKEKPTLGICLGMHLLTETSEESLNVKGLGLLEGKCLKFNADLIVPHIGWNTINMRKKSYLFRNIKDQTPFYFVHSYYVKIENKKNIITETNYKNFNFVSSFNCENIYGVQYHPEKSSIHGLEVYKNFKELL